jgi:hypothetical protein
VVRNPIFAAVILTFLGMALMVPNPVAIAGVVLSVTGIEVQVRLADEPYPRRVHATTYTTFASRVGRFLPGLGRLRRERQYRTLPCGAKPFGPSSCERRHDEHEDM